jgi:hypothetical protein
MMKQMIFTLLFAMIFSALIAAQNASSVFHVDFITEKIGDNPVKIQSDGKDLWVANFNSSSVSRVRASDGKLLGTWTGATNACAVLVAVDKVFVAGFTSNLYVIDPNQPPGEVTIVTDSIAGSPQSLAFDGSRIWTANKSGSISIVTPGSATPWAVETVSANLGSIADIIFDGSNMWASDSGAGKLYKIDLSGNIIQTVEVGRGPICLAFDGANVWAPNYESNTVSVVRVATGDIVTTLKENGLSKPIAAAFDGENILVTNSGKKHVSFWRAADLAPLGFLDVSGRDPNGGPYAAYSIGSNFWVTLCNIGKLVRISK